MDLGLRGRNVLLLGAGRGLGAAAALSIAHDGGRVALVARTEADVRARAAECMAAGAEKATAIAADAGGNAYVVGNTGSSDFPTVQALQGKFGGGGQDVVVARRRRLVAAAVGRPPPVAG